MEPLSLEQFAELRKRGITQEQIIELQKKNKVTDVLKPKETFMQKGLLRSASSFLGMEEFGKGIGQAIYNITGEGKKVQSDILQQQQSTTDKLVTAIKDARARGDMASVDRLLKAAQTFSTDSQKTDFVGLGTQGLSNREVIGSAIQTGLTFGSLLGAGPTAQGIGKATGLTGNTVKQAIVRGAGAGALGGAAFGGAEAITEGEAVAPGILKGAAMGAVTGGVLSGVGQYIKNLSSVKSEDVLLNQIQESGAAKTLKKKFQENTVTRTINGKKEVISDPISTIVQAKAQPKVVNGKIDVTSSRESIRNLINQQKDQVTKIVEESTDEGVTTSLMTLKQAAIEKVRADESLKARGIVKKTETAVSNIFDDFIDSYGDELTTKQVNTIREGMNRVFNADTVDAERAIGDAARRYVYQNAPGARELLVREGQLIAADKFLDALADRPISGGKIGKYFNNLVGAMAGATTDVPVVGPVAGALGMNKVTELIQRQALDPIMPKAARGLMSIFEALPTDAAGNISKTTLLSVIGQLSNQEGQQ